MARDDGQHPDTDIARRLKAANTPVKMAPVSLEAIRQEGRAVVRRRQTLMSGVGVALVVVAGASSLLLVGGSGHDKKPTVTRPPELGNVGGHAIGYLPGLPYELHMGSGTCAEISPSATFGCWAPATSTPAAANSVKPASVTLRLSIGELSVLDGFAGRSPGAEAITVAGRRAEILEAPGLVTLVWELSDHRSAFVQAYGISRAETLRFANSVS